MRRADLAETILSLAAPRERAASIAGDFLEEDLVAFRFWFLVGRTATAQAWRQLAAGPKAFAGIVIRGMMAECAYSLAACFVYVYLVVVLVGIQRACFHTARIPDWEDPILRWSALNLLVPFWVGRWITRRFGGRAASGSLALAIFHAALNLCVGLVLLEGPRIGLTCHLDVSIFIYWHDYGAVFRSAILYATLYPVMLLAGSAFFRTRYSGT